MLLSEIVSTSAGVADTSGRKAKIDQIAGLLARVPVDEVPVAVAFLSGDLTQRQIGVGYAALMGLPDSWSPWSGSGAEAGAEVAGPSAQDAVPDLAGAVAAEEAHTAPAARASLTLTETDAAFEEIGALLGARLSGQAPGAARQPGRARDRERAPVPGPADRR